VPEVAFSDLDLEELLAPIEGDKRVGIDPEDDSSSERFDINKAFDVSISDVPSDDGQGKKHDWVATSKQIYDYFGTSKDIWLSVYLARAGALGKRLDVVCLGIACLKGLLERYWVDLYPTIEELGLIGRVTPCNSLLGQSSFLKPLQDVTILNDRRFGSFSAADLIRYGSDETGQDSFRAALDAAGPEALERVIGQYGQIKQDLRDIDALFDANSTDEDGTYLGQGPNFAALYSVLDECVSAIRRYLPGDDGSLETDQDGDGHADPDGASSSSSETGSGRALSGQIETRQDVIKAINLICDYYVRKEPGSPVPMALERAKSWVGKSFLDVMTDLSPDSLEKIREVLTVRENS
jgi:type VI secretion system ImpA family protein